MQQAPAAAPHIVLAIFFPACRCEHCDRSFGFHLYPVSEKVENELREELKRDQERWMRKREQSQKRSARAERNTVAPIQGATEARHSTDRLRPRQSLADCRRMNRGFESMTSVGVGKHHPA